MKHRRQETTTIPGATPNQRSRPVFRLWVCVVLLAASCGTSPATPHPTATGQAPAPPPSGDAQAAQDQDVSFERISVDQGLSESSVHCIYQDSKGFLWFCTQDGLDRYDGQNFTVYRRDPNRNSIAFNYVRSVCESPEGVLWIATVGGGLDRLDLETGRFTHYPASAEDAGPATNWLWSLFCDRDGTVWMGPRRAGLDHLDPKTGEFTHYRHVEGEPRSLGHDAINAIYRDREGVLWIGTDDGLDRGDPVRQRFIHYRHDPNDPRSLSGSSVRAIFEDREGVLWIGTDGGLNRYDRQSNRFVQYRHDPADPTSLVHNAVQAIFEDREGVLWIGTEAGLSRLDPERARFTRYQNDFSDPDSLSLNWIWSIYQDREGVLWFGTHGGGINKYDRLSERFAHYRAHPGEINSLASSVIWSVYGDPDGILWIGTGGAGLERLDRETGQVTHYQHDPADPHSLGHNTVRAICPDRDGMLWIGTDGGGLDRFDPETEQFVHYRYDPDDTGSLSHDALRAIYEDRQGVLWIGTDGGGVSRFDGETDRFYRYAADPDAPASVKAGSVWSFAQDVAGALWIGTAGGGLHRLDRDTGQFTSYYWASDDIILSIHPDDQEQLWIATFGNGLYRFDPGTETLLTYGENDGLPSNVVLGILEDDQGFLWLSTNNGLSRFDPRTETFKNYDVSDGLQSQEFNAGAYHRSQTGEMFFGGPNGLNAFYPDRIQEDNPYVPPVVLTSLTLDGEPVDVRATADRVRAFTLEWPDNDFEFEFAALSYSRPEKNQHAYMLEGFDREWTYAGTRRYGKYTNLPGGTYTLRIKGSNGDGVWNEEGSAVRVTVIPPFWQTWAFRVIVLVVLALGAVGFYRQRVKSVEARSRELERVVEERTREIERRRRVAEGLRDILAVLNSDRPLDEVLDYIVTQACRLLDAKATILHQVDRENRILRVRASAGLPPELADAGAIAFDASWADEAILTGQPCAIPDLAERATTQVAAEAGSAADRWLVATSRNYRSFLAVPLVVEGKVDHCLALYYPEPQVFPDEEVGLAVTLADQAALAIENARLYENARELAAVEERQRLARDLHDAVSQTLFSASLIAEAVPEVWKSSPDEGQQLLEKLRQLSRGAQAEMRALLIELRPAALAEASLIELLRQLAQAVTGREGIPVMVEVDEPCDLPGDVRIALYRIAQEALNNVVKHAHANQVDVRLHCLTVAADGDQPAIDGSGRQEADVGQQHVELVIRDDGCGFDLDGVTPERLGMGIMRERAEAIGAELSIESTIGQGTQVTVVWNAEDGGRGVSGGR